MGAAEDFLGGAGDGGLGDRGAFDVDEHAAELAGGAADRVAVDALGKDDHVVGGGQRLVGEPVPPRHGRGRDRRGVGAGRNLADDARGVEGAEAADAVGEGAEEGGPSGGRHRAGVPRGGGSAVAEHAGEVAVAAAVVVAVGSGRDDEHLPVGEEDGRGGRRPRRRCGGVLVFADDGVREGVAVDG
ncbi:putative UPF0392 protein-like [Iris pallida]|uniref:UPF0392 protein-like n=1 Tax=Iris pallida TaxID=29817 RepID=A0AAX6EEH5_IRIPA|nr:putative UPF0392 protein-like [Iris pallida]